MLIIGRIILLVLVVIFSNQLIAAEYNSNKKYSYEEVGEILSTKILENKERVNSLEQAMQELKYKNEQEVALLKSKVSELNNRIMQNEQQSTVLNARMTELYKLIKQNDTKKNTVVSENPVQEKRTKDSIAFDKELYEKVK